MRASPPFGGFLRRGASRRKCLQLPPVEPRALDVPPSGGQGGYRIDRSTHRSHLPERRPAVRRYLSSPSLLVREAPVPVLGLALLAVTITFLVTSAQSSISWRGDFETGNLSQWNLVPQATDPSRATVQTSVVRQGRYATRIEVRPGDNNVAGSGSGERTDLLISRATTQGYEGNEAYWAWS